MKLGENTAVRLLVRLQNIREQISAAATRIWTGEYFGNVQATELDALQELQDRKSAIARDLRYTHENASTFALRRDYRYGQRSRKWLYAKAMQTKLDRNYDQWTVFIRLNLVQGDFYAKATDVNPQQLAEQSFDQLNKS